MIVVWFLLLLTPIISDRFDIEDIYYDISKVGNVRLIGAMPCDVTGAFAITAALEIANFIISGQATAFSVQEIVDCHHGGCVELGYSQIIAWLVVNDRLAPADKYTNYRSKVYTCRAATSADGLVNIRVTGYRDIEVDDFEQEFMSHGSVLACIDNSERACYSYREYRDGIINGHASEECMVKVLIVGFTELYYRVRTSNGDLWGENGYFRILRGGNRCGIEAHMGVMDTEPRYYKPNVHPYNGCPMEYPRYCKKTKACRANGQSCLPEMESAISIARKKEDQERRRPNAYDFPSRRRRSIQAEERELNCDDVPGYSCPRIAHLCGSARIRDKCGGTCEVCNPDGTPRCVDQEEYAGQCREFGRYCRLVPAIRMKCPVTCRIDPRDCHILGGGLVTKVVRYNPPPTGQCYPPNIPNGRVLNPGPLLQPGEQLQVQCDTGYTLIGKDTYCEIQNNFKPDSRRLPTCAQFGDEEYTGRGGDYTGTLNRTVSGRICQNWQESAHEGKFMKAGRGFDMMLGGNHNFCRNFGEEDPVPYCFTLNGQIKEYCFELPRCGGSETDPCGQVRKDMINCTDDSIDIEPYDCEFTNEFSRARRQWLWDHCGAMCCEYAGCQ